jgi:PAS domain S-box-containing protein
MTPLNLFAKSTVASRLLIAILLVSFIFTAAGTLLQLYLDYRTDMSFIEKQLQQVEEGYLKSLAKSTWDLDEQSLRLQLDGILQLQDVRYLEIRTELGQSLIRVGDRGGDRIQSHLFFLDHPYREQTYAVGTLEIVMSLEGVYERLWNKLRVILATQSIKIFCMSAFILLIFRLLITRHLTAMAAYARGFNLERLDQPLILNRKTGPQQTEDELEIMVNAFNQMRMNLIDDIDRRHQVEEDLRRMRNYLDNIVNSMPSALVGIDPVHQVTLWNRQCEILTHIPALDAVGQPMARVFPRLNHLRDRIDTAIRHQRMMSADRITWKDPDGSRYFNVLVYPLSANGIEGAVIRLDDITEAIRIDAMMIQTEKMISVGGLTAGMAHELNNPLGAILNSTQNIFRRLSPEFDKNRQAAEDCGVDLVRMNDYLGKRNILLFLEGIKSSGERANRIISNMLQFARKSNSSKELCQPVELMERAIELAAGDYNLKKEYDFRHIRLIRDYGTDVPAIPVVPTEIEQVFLNLLRNAAQAMTDHRKSAPPQIVLRIRPDNDVVRIDIADNGSGMDKNTRLRVFDPFFTTKPVGRGTGLGLSVSYMIITHNHQGTLEVESTPGEGTRFIIRLPMSADASADA